ncbi:MAG: 1-acyl-sn-glycerol-3-phosphate acyltransferase [Alphaproteobacteria bacterium]|nr:1-acyl-sn-glycerol-3-phosphate acyltransferase [Alphaproteobacteria bacterium]
MSWLDIFVLGLKLDAVFVAKSDVADWPLLGRLARMRQCVFVTRQAAQVAKEVQLIRAHLQAGRNVILFPEGTTGGGGRRLPFKSSLLAALDGLPHSLVQPVTIAYPDLVRGGADASLAWYGDMSMMRICGPCWAAPAPPRARISLRPWRRRIFPAARHLQRPAAPI